MTPGQNQKPSRAGALALTTGALHHGLEPRTTNALFRDLLGCVDTRYPAERERRRDVVVDNATIHQAKAVEQWLATHPRVTRRLLPTYGPRANPLKPAFGDVPDGGPRHHRRQR
jgi:hypothetical protein